jgi:hypothetical protein
MRRRIILLAAILTSLAGGAALAQNAPAPVPSDAAKAMVGAWEISNADRDKTCAVIFHADPAPGGLKLDLDKSCPNAFPATKDIVAWTLGSDGTLRMVDAAGNAVLELAEVESGIYDGFRPGEGRYILQNTASAPVRTAEQMFGDWAVARGTGKPICMLTLANNAAGANNFALKVKPGCNSLVTRFAPTSWRMDQGDLVLMAANGQTWRFEENDANTWQRVPESPDPVLLVRQ